MNRDPHGVDAVPAERGWVVVLLMSQDSRCGGFAGRDCVQSVLVRPDGTPFPTNDEAKAEARRWPDWCAPHTMLLTPAAP